LLPNPPAFPIILGNSLKSIVILLVISYFFGVLTMENLTQSQIHEYNMAILTRIRELCVSRNTSITKIEKALGYGNGTVSGWNKAKKKAPYDRVVAIAIYLGVSPDYLETGHRREKAPGTEAEGGAEMNEYLEQLRTRPEMKMLFHTFKGATKEQIEAIVAAWEAMNEAGKG